MGLFVRLSALLFPKNPVFGRFLEHLKWSASENLTLHFYRSMRQDKDIINTFLPYKRQNVHAVLNPI